MIEEPPLLLIKDKRRKPDPTKIDALRGVPTGILTDAMNGRGALSCRVSALSPDVLPTDVCGPALTCLCGPADILAILGSLYEISANEVLVIATDNWSGCAVTGDRVVGMIKNAGGAGVVTDGLVRDVAGVEAVGLPVFCAGVSPNSPFANGPGEIGFTVQLAGVSVDSGDVIVGDRSIYALEEEMDGKVSRGMKYPESIGELMNSEKIKRV